MAGLNPTETDEAVELIRKIHAMGLTLIVVEHVMEVIMDISSELRLRLGRADRRGPPERVVRTNASSRLTWVRTTMLKVNSISVRYSIIPVLLDVTFSVEEGQFVAIVGANSAGKSTILRTVSGLIHPFEGSIEFRGEAIHGAQPYDIAAKGSPISRGAQDFRQAHGQRKPAGGGSHRSDEQEVQKSLEEMFTLFPSCGSARTRRARP